MHSNIPNASIAYRNTQIDFHELKLPFQFIELARLYGFRDSMMSSIFERTIQFLPSRDGIKNVEGIMCNIVKLTFVPI